MCVGIEPCTHCTALTATTQHAHMLHIEGALGARKQVNTYEPLSQNAYVSIMQRADDVGQDGGHGRCRFLPPSLPPPSPFPPFSKIQRPGSAKTSLYRRRVAELKHGRVCMLATVGVLVQSFVHLPDPERHAFSNTRPLGALLQARA